MSALASAPPVLESGDRLTREEFHRRYCARPDIKKAELVERFPAKKAAATLTCAGNRRSEFTGPKISGVQWAAGNAKTGDLVIVAFFGQGGPLGKGTLYGAELGCPWHGWRWDVASGRNCWPGTDWRVPKVPVRIVGDEIQLPVL